MPERKKRILVVAADGGAARFFVASRLGGTVCELEAKRMSAPPPTPAPKPTRVHDRFGPARHSVEARQSPHDAAQTRFLADVAAAISHEIDQFDEAVLCAPPRALGLLREQLSDAVRARLTKEIAKDYVRATPEKLSALLAHAPA